MLSLVCIFFGQPMPETAKTAAQEFRGEMEITEIHNAYLAKENSKSPHNKWVPLLDSGTLTVSINRPSSYKAVEPSKKIHVRRGCLAPRLHRR